MQKKVDFEKLLIVLEAGERERNIDVLSKFAHYSSSGLEWQRGSDVAMVFSFIVSSFSTDDEFQQIIFNLVENIKTTFENVEFHQNVEESCTIICESIAPLANNTFYHSCILDLFASLSQSQHPCTYSLLFTLIITALSKIFPYSRILIDSLFIIIETANQEEIKDYLVQKLPSFSESETFLKLASSLPVGAYVLRALTPFNVFKNIHLIDFLQNLLCSQYKSAFSIEMSASSNIHLFSLILSNIDQHTGRDAGFAIRTDLYLVILMIIENIQDYSAFGASSIPEKVAQELVRIIDQKKLKNRKEFDYLNVLFSIYTLFCEYGVYEHIKYENYIFKFLEFLNTEDADSKSDTWAPFDYIRTATLIIDAMSYKSNTVYLSLLHFAYMIPTEEPNQLIVALLIFLQDIVSAESHLGDNLKFCMGTLVNILKSKKFTINTKSEVYLLLSLLGHSKNDFQSLFHSSGALEEALKGLNFKSGNSKEEATFLFTVVDAIWSLGICYHENETILMDKEGAFTLVNFLASHNDRRFVAHVLGSLVDLLDNSRAVQHALFWTSQPKNVNIGSLLIQMWNVEEKLSNVKHDINNCIENLDDPLNDTMKDKDLFHKQDPIEEIQSNFKSKLFLILSNLGFDKISEMVTFEEKITLALIEKYFDFKIGQVWKRVDMELCAERVLPVPVDSDIINTAKQVVSQKANTVYLEQSRILESKKERETIEENIFFETVKKRSIGGKKIITGLVI